MSLKKKPAKRLIGYARVSTQQQDLARQLGLIGPKLRFWGRRPIRVKAHGSVLHAMLRVELAPAG
jgi:predicted site-specific integrase-resolvase